MSDRAEIRRTYREILQSYPVDRPIPDADAERRFRAALWRAAEAGDPWAVRTIDHGFTRRGAAGRATRPGEQPPLRLRCWLMDELISVWNTTNVWRDSQRVRLGLLLQREEVA